MAKGGQKTTTTTGIDPASQAYLDQQRAAAQQAAGVAANTSPFTGPQTQSIAQQTEQFMNPYQDQVIGAVNSQFDKLGQQSVAQTNAMATQAGAFGGARHGIAQGTRQGNLDATRMGIVANLQKSGYDTAVTQGTQYAEHQRQLQEQKNMEPLWQQQQRLGLLQSGMGPTGTTSTTTQPGPSMWGQLGGLAMTGLGAATGLGWAPFAAKAAGKVLK